MSWDDYFAKSFYWQRLLDSGQARDTVDIARRFGVRSAWVSEILRCQATSGTDPGGQFVVSPDMRLTRLSPSILTAISRGTQPRWLTLQALRGRSQEISLLWREQEAVLGFDADL